VELIEEEEEKKEMAPPDEPPALEPPDASRSASIEESESRVTIPPVVRWVILGLVAIIVIFLIILLIRWIIHAASDNSPTPAGNTTSQTSDLNKKIGAGTSRNGTNNNGSRNNGAAGSSGQNGQNLPNNGPGNVLGVFAGSALAAAGLHYIISLRRANRDY